MQLRLLQRSESRSRYVRSLGEPCDLKAEDIGKAER